MDPWQPCPTNSSSTDYVISPNLDDNSLHNEQGNPVQDLSSSDLVTTTIASSDHEKHKGDLSFGDDFRPYVKLPDSAEYLESLEKKLKKIQKGGGKGANADSILRSLAQSKESCMIKLLSNSVEKLTVEGEIFEELKVNPLLKKLAPEKQALTAEELVHLLKADQLEILLNNCNTTEDSTCPTVPEAGNSGVEESDKEKTSSENQITVESTPAVSEN